MKKSIIIVALMVFIATVAKAQTLNVVVGDVIYQFPAADAGTMPYTDGTSVTIEHKTFAISDITRMYVDATEVDSTTVSVLYDGSSAKVYVAGDIAHLVTPTVSGAHVSIAQSSDVAEEITYSLSGTSSDGEFYMSGSYKATIELAGLTLTNPSGAAINITNSKRIQLSAKRNTENTLTDGSDGSQKACIYSKGQLQLQGNGTLNVAGKTKHAIKSASYVSIKNLTLNINSAVGDGISCEEYPQMKSGTITIKGVGDDAIQVDLDGTDSTGETTDHEDEDSGNIYFEGGTLNLTVTADAAKGIKAGGDVRISGGSITITQTGGIVADTDISYPTSIKADGNIAVTGGTINITNTAAGGKGMSAEGTLTIDESAATTVIDIKANGKGGTAETSGSGDDDTPAASYKVYISLPTTGGGGGPGGGGSNAWKNPVLYKSDGTKVTALTSTVTKTASSGYSSLTFYYYDFGEAVSGTYYIQGDNYTSRGTTYTIKSATFSAPTSGSDIYYSISNSYQTSGTTRTYSLSNVTNTYGGTSDVSEDNGTSYNAIGLKADMDMTISAGTITIANSGAMSKSIKSKKNVTIDGGTITLKPSGAMQVINSDASYSSGIKCDDLTLNDGTVDITATGTAGRGISAANVITNGGTLTITNSGAGQTGSNDSYTAKGIKADQSIALNDGAITITMSGTGGKGIKSSGTYTQGKSGGSGPTLKVTTTGSALGGSSGGGGWPGQQSNSGSSAKGIKVQGAVTIYGGETEVSTSTNGAEGLESKTSITFEGGKHYLKCYDDCINSSGNIVFNGGVTVCYGFGNDAIDSNAGRTGAITIGNGVVFAYTTRGAPEEGFDCDNNSYIQITGTGIGISAGAAQGGGGGWGGSGNTISNAKQGYAFVTSSISYAANRYYTLADASGKNLVTYSFEASCSSSLALFTATGMVKGSEYNVKYSTTAPTDATTAWHGLYIGSSHTGTNAVTSFEAQ